MISDSCVKLLSLSPIVLVCTVLTTFLVSPLNFVVTKYTIPDITYFVCRTFLSTRHLRFSTLEFLVFIFTIPKN